MRKTIFSLITVAALVPMTASAQTSGQATATARATSQTSASAGRTGAASSTDAAAEARIRASMKRAENNGVPRQTLENKVAEGRAKGASEARIATAVEHRADVLMRVHAAMQKGERQNSAPADKSDKSDNGDNADAKTESETVAELTAAADAYEGGVSLSSITSLTAHAGNNRGVALSVLANLVATGNTAPAEAVVRVESALDAGANVLAELGASAAASAAAAKPPVTVNGNSNTKAAASTPKVSTGVTSSTVVKIIH